MSVVLSRILILVLCLFSLVGQCESRGTLPPLYDFQNKVERARSSFEDVYYELVKSHFFDDVNNPNTPYSNNLIISTSLNDDLVKQGTILLGLISWLEKKNDRDSRFLLRKVNRLYHLEFHRTLVSLNPKNENYKNSLMDSFHALSKYKVFNVAIGTDYPFRTAITKAVLTLLVVNKASIPYVEKKESVVYTLQKIKQDMLRVNNNLGKEKVDEEVIQAFIFGLEKFGVRETLVESKIFRNLIITTIIILLISFCFYRWDLVAKGSEKAGKWANDFFTQAINGLTKKMAEGFEEVWHINARANRIEAQLSPQGVADLSRRAGESMMDALAISSEGAALGDVVSTPQYIAGARQRFHEQQIREQAALEVAQAQAALAVAEARAALNEQGSENNPVLLAALELAQAQAALVLVQVEAGLNQPPPVQIPPPQQPIIPAGTPPSGMKRVLARFALNQLGVTPSDLDPNLQEAPVQPSPAVGRLRSIWNNYFYGVGIEAPEDNINVVPIVH